MAPKNPSKQVHVPLVKSQMPRLEQSTWHLFPGRPTPRPPAAVTFVQFCSLMCRVTGSSPEGQCRRAQFAPKYSGVWVWLEPRPTGQDESQRHLRRAVRGVGVAA